MPQANDTDAIKKLRSEVEMLREEGLRRLEAWDTERRETKRVHAAAVRYRNLASDREAEVSKLRETLEVETERAAKAEQLLEVLKVRIDELRDALRTFGEHRRDCQKRQKLFAKRDAPCTCGYEQVLEGGGSLEEAE